MKANDSINRPSVAERFDTFTCVIFHCNNQNTAHCKANNFWLLQLKMTLVNVSKRSTLWFYYTI